MLCLSVHLSVCPYVIPCVSWSVPTSLKQKIQWINMKIIWAWIITGEENISTWFISRKENHMEGKPTQKGKWAEGKNTDGKPAQMGKPCRTPRASELFTWELNNMTILYSHISHHEAMALIGWIVVVVGVVVVVVGIVVVFGIVSVFLLPLFRSILRISIIGYVCPLVHPSDHPLVHPSVHPLVSRFVGWLVHNQLVKNQYKLMKLHEITWKHMKIDAIKSQTSE